ncbi:bifunctional diguanylate cyclase/phosphodiesterase [Hahella sp. HN01]|uniref:putative bifunctional diguanylate cyclase/phosphodiesterase n=1 Tax=Hahella sp. HN01 TaxID=2847262 RepID=UPI001C1F159A|nr:GGDEF and EAL domain-containing protein [Hahella sp. HN01]MBU6952718.1 EAL domain-containing protein [Hahella sp. HN01]
MSEHVGQSLMNPDQSGVRAVSCTEDNVDVLAVVKSHCDFLWLQHLTAAESDIQLHWCNSIPMAMDILRKRKFDMVLWEENQFDGDKDSFLRILSHHADAPVVALGPFAEERHARGLILAGAADYLCKSSLDASLLVRALRRAWYRELFRLDFEMREQLDSLTGILDRARFYDRLHQAILRAERVKHRVGLIFVNVDEFRTVNQTLGYRAGDILIKMMAARLRQVLRRSDCLARVGGDEFAVILEDGQESFSLINVAKKMAKVFEQAFVVNQHPVNLTASMGMAVFPESGDSADLLLRRANQAMFDAKKEHGVSYRFFNDRMNRELDMRLELETEFRQALRGDKLDLYYQPKIEVRSGEVVGMEALVRWPHPRLGVLTPAAFIAAAERSSLIIPMGYWVLERACRDLNMLQTMGYDDLVCAVNLSFRQFFDRRLSETVFRIIYNANIDTTKFEFELTESAMMFDRDYTLKCLKELTHLGLHFALDDFGTGYSSFTNLRNLPISTVKIDKSFIENVCTIAEDATLVSGMISLAHSLSMTVVAEGVEKPEQLEFLRQHNCDQAQGYWFARPLPFNEFCDFLQVAGDLRRLRKQ